MLVCLFMGACLDDPHDDPKDNFQPEIYVGQAFEGMIFMDISDTLSANSETWESNGTSYVKYTNANYCVPLGSVDCGLNFRIVCSDLSDWVFILQLPNGYQMADSLLEEGRRLDDYPYWSIPDLNFHLSDYYEMGETPDFIGFRKMAHNDTTFGWIKVSQLDPRTILLYEIAYQ